MKNTVKLGHICKLNYGKALDRKDRLENGVVSVYGANGIKTYTDKFLHDKPSIIIGRKGSAGELNKVAEPFWALDVTYFVTVDESIVDLDFLFYSLITLNLPSMARGVKPGINRNDVYDKSINLPPLAEQQRIVAKLDVAFAEIDGAIEVANAKVKEVNCLFKKELENTFSNGEFESVNLEELAKVTSSKRVLKSHYVESGIPFYRTKEIKELANGNPIGTELFISQEQFSEFKNKFGAPQAGDVLITAIGTIGEVYVVQQGDEFYFKDGNILWLRNIRGLNSDYLRYSLINFVDELNSLAHGAAYSALPIQRLKSHKIPIKALSEQTSSVVKLDALGKLTQDIDKLNSNKISALGVLKSAILAQELQSEAV